MPMRLLALWRATGRSHIVHIFSSSHSSFVVATLPAWGVARLLRRRTVVHYHTGRARDHLERSALARFVLRRSDAVVVPSRYLADVFADFRVPTTIVPNAVDARELRYRERRVIRPYLVCTRNLQPRYAVDVVVRAFAAVKQEVPSARLFLVGTGPEAPALRALVHALRVSDVEFCGAVPRDRIGDVLNDADIFVNASRVDSMPVSILEAFAAGLPVVSTATGGIPQLVEHERTGLLSPIGDAAALARNILHVVGEQALGRRLAHNAHEESARYHWPAVRSEWLRVYRAIDRADTVRRCSQWDSTREPPSRDVR
jgi:glycosyltransferase involved in cell wall biosynthesis